MRIGFDAKRALNNATGLGNYARVLLNSLMKFHAEEEYLLFSPKVRDEFLQELQGNFQTLYPERKRDRVFPSLWRSYGIIKQLQGQGVQLYHGLSNELPYKIHRSKVKSVVTIHDLIFLKHHEQYPFLDRQLYEMKSRYAAQHADKIVAVSNETKNDLIKFYQVPPEKIVVIHQSVAPSFYEVVSEDAKAAVRDKYSLPEKFILNVSSFFPRKNHKSIIQAFDLIHTKVQEDLVLVGAAGFYQPIVRNLISQQKSAPRIRIIDHVSNEDMPALYQMASVFVYPSLFEGFGLPVLEAIASRTPVVSSSKSCMEDAGGPHCSYVNPHQPDQIAEALFWILSNPVLQNENVAKSFAHARTFSPEAFAAKTMNLYREVLSQ